MPGRRDFIKALASAPFAFASPLEAQQAQGILPYIQRVDENRAVVLWSTVESGRGQIEWLTAGTTTDWASTQATTQAFEASQTGLGFSFYQHRVELENLPEGGTVHYRLRWNDRLQAGATGSFRTAYQRRVLDRFVAFGDSGLDTPEQMALMTAMAREDPSLVIHTGDLAYPVASYDGLRDRYLTPYAGLMAKAPFFPCPGNHDYGFENAKAYLNTHALPMHPEIREDDRGRYYAFRWGPVRFISLDSNDPLGVPGQNPMMKWLDTELTRSRDFWRVAIFHHPPYTESFHRKDYFVKLSREMLAPVLEANHIPLVLNGHEHFYQRSHPIRNGDVQDPGAGTVYVTTGGGGAHLYPVEPSPRHAFGYSAHHYMRVELAGYTMIVKAVGIGGVELDQFEIKPQPAIDADSPVNSADFKQGVAPGGLMTIFGRHFALCDERNQSLPVATRAGEVLVTLGGRAVPILYAGPGQINVQLPFDCPEICTLEVTTPNGSNSISMQAPDTAPAFFAVRTESGFRPAIFAEAGGQVITEKRPAAAGDILTAYLTGLGRVNAVVEPGTAPEEIDGPRVLARVRLRLGDTVLTPSYAGLARGLVGVYRVTFRIPPDAGSGERSLQLVAGAAASEVQRLFLS